MDLGQRAALFKFLIRDRDSKFITGFDELFAGNGTRVIKAPVRSPRANSFAERFVGTVRRECLDHVLILGERHLPQVLANFALFDLVGERLSPRIRDLGKITLYRTGPKADFDARYPRVRSAGATGHPATASAVPAPAW